MSSESKNPKVLTAYVVRSEEGLFLNKGEWHKELNKAFIYTGLAGPRIAVTSYRLKHPEAKLTILELRTDVSRFKEVTGEEERIALAMQKRAASERRKEFPPIGSTHWTKFARSLKTLEAKPEKTEQEVAELTAAKAHYESELKKVMVE